MPVEVIESIEMIFNAPQLCHSRSTKVLQKDSITIKQQTTLRCRACILGMLQNSSLDPRLSK
jgi:hypothetical protein